MPDIGIEVERALGRGEAVDPRLRQRVEQQRAIGRIARDMPAQFVVRVEGGERRDLGDAGAEMNRFWASRSTGRVRSSGSTIQPTRQPVMDQYFENELITTAPGIAAAVAAGSP